MGKKKKNTQLDDMKKIRARAKLLVNPKAGGHPDPSARLELATRCLLDHGISVDVEIIKSKDKTTNQARRAAEDGFKMVIVMGGDGTVESAARGLVGAKTRLGILPAGKTNSIAKSLGIPEDLEAACALIEQQNFRRLDVGVVKNKKIKKFYFFRLVAVGLAAALYPKGKNLSPDMVKGKLSSKRAVAKTLLQFETPKIFLSMDEEKPLEVESMLAIVSNTPAWGMNFQAALEAEEDGLLDVSVYPKFTKAELIAYFAQEGQSSNGMDSRVQRYQARKVTIKAKPKLLAMADGYILGKGKVTVRIKRKALRVIIPPESAPAEEQKMEAPEAEVPEAEVQEEMPTPMDTDGSPNLEPAGS